MHNFIFRANTLFMTLLCCLTFSTPAEAKDGFETSSDVLAIVLPATAAAITLSAKDNEGLVQLAESGALTLATTYGLKYAITATRPNGGKHSFPSGHTSVAFASAEFIRERYGWNYGIPAYIAASFTGYGRVESKQHYTRDVLAGAAIGIGSSFLFTTPNKEWQIKPQVASSFYGVGLSRSW